MDLSPMHTESEFGPQRGAGYFHSAWDLPREFVASSLFPSRLAALCHRAAVCFHHTAKHTHNTLTLSLSSTSSCLLCQALERSCSLLFKTTPW
jgi:hypothetical protein